MLGLVLARLPPTLHFSNTCESIQSNFESIKFSTVMMINTASRLGDQGGTVAECRQAPVAKLAILILIFLSLIPIVNIVFSELIDGSWYQDKVQV